MELETMSKTTFIIGALAVFAGVFGALQFDEWLDRRKDAAALDADPSLLRNVAIEESSQAGAPDFRAAAKKVIPSVVSVDQYRRMESFFGEDMGLRESGSGSGVIISTNGTIVTNHHVVAGAESVKVRLSDGRALDARVLGTDQRTDLAVLKVEASNLSPIELGDNTKLEIGQWVVAVGNPLGFSNTVSVGVVSSLNRSLPLPGSILVNGIQTDAAINPGNSGGALTDAAGRLIGINSAIASNNAGSVGIGFAIPVNRVRRVVSDIVKYGQTRDGILGVNFEPRFDGLLESPNGRRQLQEVTRTEQVPEFGVIVTQAAEPAVAAGIGRFSVILEIDGKKVTDSISLNQALIDRVPGEKVKVKFWTRGQTRTADIVLAARPSRI
ncbi:MAG TPA: trypsin-like peptidase domain-containing protein [Fimbriimonas sp.]